MDGVKPKKPFYKRVWFWVVAVVVVIVVATAASHGGTTVNNQPASVSNSSSSGSGSSSSSQPAKAATAKVGDAINIGGGQGLAVKLVQIIDPASGDSQFATPDAGKRFVGVKVQITNNGTSAYKDDANNNLTLIGSDNQSYTSDVNSIAGCINFSNGEYTLGAGASATGCVNFQVPNGVTVAKVQFTPNAGFSGDTGEWLVK